MTATTGFTSDRSLEHRYADVNGVRLHYVVVGDGPLVVLLHGFPEFWYTWRHQIPALAAAGFRVVAYDLPRGALAAYYPETNPLVVLESFADESRTPTSKSVVVTLTADASSG